MLALNTNQSILCEILVYLEQTHIVLHTTTEILLSDQILAQRVKYYKMFLPREATLMTRPLVYCRGRLLQILYFTLNVIFIILFTISAHMVTTHIYILIIVLLSFFFKIWLGIFIFITFYLYMFMSSNFLYLNIFLFFMVKFSPKNKMRFFFNNNTCGEMETIQMTLKQDVRHKRFQMTKIVIASHDSMQFD